MDDERREDFELFKQYYDHLLKARQSSFEELDKSILTLSGAGLGVSLAFIKDVVPIGEIKLMSIMELSWILFALAILSTLAAYLVGQYAYDAQIERAEQFFLMNDGNVFREKNVFTVATKRLNAIAAASFILAVALTVTFTSVNLSLARQRLSQSQSQRPAPPAAGTGKSTVEKR